MYLITSESPRVEIGCNAGHSSAVVLSTSEGGSICLVCLTNLLSDPKSPTVHVSYALSQLSQALAQAQFLRTLLTHHPHFLVSPLVSVLSNLNDQPIAKQAIDIILTLCNATVCNGEGDVDVRKEFVARVSDCISSGSLAWSTRQLHMLHCFGVLLDSEDHDLYYCIRNKDVLIFNLVEGLQLPSDEIRGEIMYVFYRLSLLFYSLMDENSNDILAACCPKLLYISLDVLTKCQSDDVRLNCVAFLTVVARRGFFQIASSIHVQSGNSFEGDNFMPLTDHIMDIAPLEAIFAEAVKGPLLSSESQVQIATLELIYQYLSSLRYSRKELQIFIEENIADYIFEILRLSGNKDPIVNSCIKILDLLSAAEEAFRNRVVIGFSTLVSVLRYVAEIPFQPLQPQLLKVILNCILNSPGIVSRSNGEEICGILAEMFEKNQNGQSGMLPEAFTLSCSIVAGLLKCSSSVGNSCLATLVKDALESAICASLSSSQMHTDEILHSLYLLKEAYIYDNKDNFPNSSTVGLRSFIIHICKLQIIPWFVSLVDEMEDEAIALGVLEALYSIMVLDSNVHTEDLVNSLVLSSWFSTLFGYLGLFPTETMNLRVYLIFGSIIEVLLESNFAKPFRDTAIQLPSDPMDLLFLLGQKSCHDPELFHCQSAVLLLLYISSLYNDRIADDKMVLASVEQFILLNGTDIIWGTSSSITIDILVNLYGLYRGIAKMHYQIPYSPEAERILFQLLAEKKDWDSLSTKIHSISLKWLFQQEKLSWLLSGQVLKFCRQEILTANAAARCQETSHTVTFHAIAQLVTYEDSFAPMIFVFLLRDLIENPLKEHDAISMLKACTEIVEIDPITSDRFCVHGIDGVIRNICCYSPQSFPELFMATCQLVFTILKSVRSESLSNGEPWVGIAVRLMDYLTLATTSDNWTEVTTILGILSLILHHSTKGALMEASKTIALSASLFSIVNAIITEACSKGPALFNYDEGASGEILIYVLLLIFFSLRSVRATISGIVDFQILLDDGIETRPLSYISIRCHDLCKLLHFGSPSVKLAASFCLMEIFTGISDLSSTKAIEEMKLREGYVCSISVILHGLIFCSDAQVALNSSICLSIMMKWNQSTTTSWYRLIIEELVMSLATPSLTSSSDMIHLIPAVNIAVALLKRSEAPSWMTKFFDDSTVRRVLENTTPNNLSTELVILFRELLTCGMLNSARISDLNSLFQLCRTRMYDADVRDCNMEKHKVKVSDKDDHIGKSRVFLFELVSSLHGTYMSRQKNLLEQIELFYQTLDRRA